MKRVAASVWKLFNRACDGITMASADVSGALVLFMALAIGVDVFLRYVFNAPTIWINEASRYALLMVTFLGLAYTRKLDAHIRVDFITSRLPKRLQDWARVIDSVVFLVVVSILFYLTWGLFMGSVERGSTSTSLWDPLIAPWQFFTPLGLAIVGLLLICNIYTESKIALGKAKGPDKEHK